MESEKVNRLTHKLEYLSVDCLTPAARNPRTHNTRQLKHIESSIRRFGFTTPLLISDELTVIAGHGRLLAAKKLGLEQVPCIRLSHLSAD